MGASFERRPDACAAEPRAVVHVRGGRGADLRYGRVVACDDDRVAGFGLRDRGRQASLEILNRHLFHGLNYILFCPDLWSV